MSSAENLPRVLSVNNVLFLHIYLKGSVDSKIYLYYTADWCIMNMINDEILSPITCLDVSQDCTFLMAGIAYFHINIDACIMYICFGITKTYLYNFDPLKPHFYIVKLGFTGVYIIFLISAQKHRLWYSLEPPRLSNEYPQSMF